MALKIHITDPSNNLKAEVINKYDHSALVVATKPLDTYVNLLEPFTNEIYGEDMNKDATTSGTPLKVHNGNDDILWAGSTITGGIVDFTDLAYNHTPAGASSIGFDNWTSSGNTCQILSATNIDLTDYSSLSMWIYVSANWGTDSVSVYGWDTTTGTIVGIKALLQDYVDVNNIGNWQKINISLIDLQLTNKTIDSIRFQYEVRNGRPVDFYLDDIQFEEVGGNLDYYVTPPKGKTYYITKFMIAMADEYAGTVSDGTMANIPYDKFLGVALTNGLLYTRRRNGSIAKVITWKKLIDFMTNSNARITGSGSDGTNTWLSLTFDFEYPLILEDIKKDYLKISLSDNLSELLYLRISVGGYELDE